MTEPQPEKWSTGRLERAPVIPSEPFIIDCSSWDSDIPADQWSRGKLERVCESLPAVEGDFIPSPQQYVEITLKIGPSANACDAVLLAMGMIVKIDSTVPNLGLSYHRSRSRSENGTVTIALIPKNDDEAAARIGEITRLIELEAKAFDQFTVQSIRLEKEAA